MLILSRSCCSLRIAGDLGDKPPLRAGSGAREWPSHRVLVAMPVISIIDDDGSDKEGRRLDAAGPSRRHRVTKRPGGRRLRMIRQGRGDGGRPRATRIRGRQCTEWALCNLRCSSGDSFSCIRFLDRALIGDCSVSRNIASTAAAFLFALISWWIPFGVLPKAPVTPRRGPDNVPPGRCETDLGSAFAGRPHRPANRRRPAAKER